MKQRTHKDEPMMPQGAVAPMRFTFTVHASIVEKVMREQQRLQEQTGLPINMSKAITALVWRSPEIEAAAES